MKIYISLVCILSVFILISPTVFSVETINLKNIEKINVLKKYKNGCQICSPSEELNGPTKTIICEILFFMHCILCMLSGRINWVTFILAWTIGCDWAHMMPEKNFSNRNIDL